MLTNLFNGASTMDTTSLIISIVLSLVLGLIIALTHKYTSKYSKGFLTTIALLPLLVFVVIMLVNGNLGTSVAIMGVFSLVRFRSIPGTAKEILTVFFAMAVGLTIGTGYAIFAGIITVIGSLVMFLYEKTNLFEANANQKILTIVIPEDLDYANVFDDTFKKYVNKYTLEKVKTIDMGSMFELKYTIHMKKEGSEKAFIDELRVKNGNLKIILSHPIDDAEL